MMGVVVVALKIVANYEAAVVDIDLAVSRTTATTKTMMIEGHMDSFYC